jgi:hypothetical protein
MRTSSTSLHENPRSHRTGAHPAIEAALYRRRITSIRIAAAAQPGREWVDLR